MNPFEKASQSVKARNPHLFGVEAPSVTAAGLLRESDLHDEIQAELKRRRWYYVHSRMDRATTTQLGVTDFIVASPEGITLWIECKRKGGKLTEAQNTTRHVLKALGHKHCVVFSFKDFIDFLDECVKIKTPSPMY